MYGVTKTIATPDIIHLFSPKQIHSYNTRSPSKSDN